MAKPYIFFLILLATACSKDPVALPDYYIEYDETIYTPSQNDKYSGNYCNRYECGASWKVETQNHTLYYRVRNTCDNNRGALSNYRGEVVFAAIVNNKALWLVGQRPLFEYKTIDGKRYFEFKDLKCYSQIGVVFDSLVYKTVSGRVLLP